MASSGFGFPTDVFVTFVLSADAQSVTRTTSENADFDSNVLTPGQAMLMYQVVVGTGAATLVAVAQAGS